MSGDLFPKRQRIPGRTFTDRTGFQIGWLTAVRPADGGLWAWHCSQCGTTVALKTDYVMSQGQYATCSRSCWLKAAEGFADPEAETRKRDARMVAP